MWFLLLLSAVATRECTGVIYSLNESEYNRMPSLFALDDYRSCLLESGGTYCVADFHLFSETNSTLMHMINAYSEHKVKHYNHTQLHRGVCVTRTCRKYVNGTTDDLDRALEGCMNESIWTDYELQAKLTSIRYCEREGDTITLDTSDCVVAAVYVVLIIVNVIGSFYDILILKEEKKGNPYLLAFSMRRNWSRMTAPTGSTTDPRIERLRVFHGLRTMTMICVFFSHAVLCMAHSYVDNPLYIETSYEDPFKQILFNGSLVTHTFFVTSSFLLAYNFLIYAEKHPISWLYWPKGILLRWLRLTPTYALILATISTLMRYLGSGPMWQLSVTTESMGCRQYWWAHVLYINNYIYDDTECALQTWYLAADTQLFCLGLLVCVAARSNRSRFLSLAAVFVVSLITPALHTYFQDLNAVVIQSPESYRTLYAENDTFLLVYIRAHTNLSTYTLGLAGGFLTYYWQNELKDVNKFKSFRCAYWLVFPLGVGVILTGGLFYIDTWVPPTAVRVLYAAIYKPVFQLLVVFIIVGAVFKLENVYRCIVEWRGFTWMGRVSYSAFLLHLAFQRGLVGIQTRPIVISDYFVMMILSATIFLSYMGAVALWLCVEAPVAGITKAMLAPPIREVKEDNELERSKV